MYYIEKTMEISACHCLKLSYESKYQIYRIHYARVWSIQR